jgi:hypothetical protein
MGSRRKVSVADIQRAKENVTRAHEVLTAAQWKVDEAEEEYRALIKRASAITVKEAMLG